MHIGNPQQKWVKGLAPITSTLRQTIDLGCDLFSNAANCLLPTRPAKDKPYKH